MSNVHSFAPVTAEQVAAASSLIDTAAKAGAVVTSLMIDGSGSLSASVEQPARAALAFELGLADRYEFDSSGRPFETFQRYADDGSSRLSIYGEVAR